MYSPINKNLDEIIANTDVICKHTRRVWGIVIFIVNFTRTAIADVSLFL